MHSDYELDDKPMLEVELVLTCNRFKEQNIHLLMEKPMNSAATDSEDMFLYRPVRVKDEDLTVAYLQKKYKLSTNICRELTKSGNLFNWENIDKDINLLPLTISYNKTDMPALFEAIGDNLYLHRFVWNWDGNFEEDNNLALRYLREKHKLGDLLAMNFMNTSRHLSLPTG